MLRIAYFGLPLGALLLREDGHDLRICVLSPVAGPGVRRIHRLLEGRVLDARGLASALEPTVEAFFARESVDLLVSWFWTRKLPARWLEAARFGGIGAHPSLLPRHRGPNPYFWAIDEGDTDTGVSVHRLEPEYDTGPVIEQRRIVVGGRNAWQLARALDRPSLAALRSCVRNHSEGRFASGEPQDPGLSSLAPEPSGEFLRVDFRWPTARVLRRIRALSPVPGLALHLSGIDFFVTEASEAADFVRALEPGEAQIVGDRLLLRTGDSAISVDRATLPDDPGDCQEISGEGLARLLGGRLGGSWGNSLQG